MLVSIGVNDCSYKDYNGSSPKCSWHYPYKKFNKDDTFIVIFGYYQDEEKDKFLAQDDINIIFVAEKAVNKHPNHGTSPRNTVVVWEFKDEPSNSA